MAVFGFRKTRETNGRRIKSRNRSEITTWSENIRVSEILCRATLLRATPRKFVMMVVALARAAWAFIWISPMRFSGSVKTPFGSGTAICSTCT